MIFPWVFSQLNARELGFTCFEFSNISYSFLKLHKWRMCISLDNTRYFSKMKCWIPKNTSFQSPGYLTKGTFEGVPKFWIKRSLRCYSELLCNVSHHGYIDILNIERYKPCDNFPSGECIVSCEQSTFNCEYLVIIHQLYIEIQSKW